jgi:tetratricopeptide (TPR) repeat protein
VAARTSCFAFKGRNEDIRKIGDALGVETVLEGSLRRVGTKLRITAQLIKVADGFSLWSERFDREMQDVFAIQDDITRAIMAALKLRLAGRSDQPVFKLQTANAEAYELYLKGRFFWNQRGIGLRKALHYFELALIEDPDYALAMSGLSDTYSLLSWYGDLPPAEAIPKAIAPAKRAAQLDPQLAEAHTSLGFCQLCNWDRAGAEREFRRAIALNPRTTPARYWLGWLYSSAGRHEEAIEHCRQAVELEPLSAIDRMFFGWMYYHAGKFDEAEQHLRKRDRTRWGRAFGFLYLAFGQSLCCRGQARPGVPRARHSGGKLAGQRVDEVHAGSCLGRVWRTCQSVGNSGGPAGLGQIWLRSRVWRRDDLPRTGRPRPSPDLAGEGLQRPRCLGSHAQGGSDLRAFANGRSLCRSAEEGRTGTMSAHPRAAKPGDAVLAAQALQHDADFVLRRKMPPRRAANVSHNLFCQFLHRPGFLSHLRSLKGYGEPEIQICLVGADAGRQDRSCTNIRPRPPDGGWPGRQAIFNMFWREASDAN